MFTFFVLKSMGEVPHAFWTPATFLEYFWDLFSPIHKALIYQKKIIILSTIVFISPNNQNFYCILFKLKGPDKVTEQTLHSKYLSPTEHFVFSLRWRRTEINFDKRKQNYLP